MITVYLKPTNFCNVGCAHCYLSEAVRADRGRMSLETLRATARMLADMAKGGRHRGIHLIWHGGEPMTLPVDWFWQAGEILDQMLPGHTESIQTSLIPYRPEFVPLIRERFAGEIGSSIDFHTRQVAGSAADYQRLWLAKVAQARSDGFFVIPGTVPSVRDLGTAAAMVDWFIRHEFPAFNVERYNRYGQDLPDWPDNAQHAGFLRDLFDALMMHGAQAPYVGVIAAAIRGVLDGVPGDRWGGSCQSDFVVVEPDGSLNNCPDKTAHEAAFSNVAAGFDAFAASPARRKSIRLQLIDHRRDHCQTCRYNSWCKSGCPITPNGPRDGQSECAGYQSFLEHVRMFCETPAGLAQARAYLGQRQPSIQVAS